MQPRRHLRYPSKKKVDFGEGERVGIRGLPEKKGCLVDAIDCVSSHHE